MADETQVRSGDAGDSEDGGAGGAGEPAPLQTRAAFLKNRSWESIISFNRGACERGRAQHGFNSETHEACAADWEGAREREITLAETFDFLRSFHKRAPFLFFNGNTFADAGRQLAAVLFADLPSARRRECVSAVGHYIAGVLDRDSLVSIIEELSAAFSYHPGDRVMTLRGSSHGVVVRLQLDGRVVWKPDGGMELMALPESLRREPPKK